MNQLEKLAAKVTGKDFVISVLGIGRVGLPLALVFARAGLKVIGVDQDKAHIESIKNCIMPFSEEGMQDLMCHPNFEPVHYSDALSKINSSDILIITVGTPLACNNNPDFSQLFSILSVLLKAQLQGKLLILRSTVPPGTLEEKVIPYIESKTGLKAGKDFGAAFCPERVLEGHAIEEISNLPEIIGAIDPLSAKIAAGVFRKINPDKKILETTPKSAELAKLYANLYRYVNFALANEFALLGEQFGEDAGEIIRILNTDYPRGGVPKPGLVGGPCLTKDGYFLLSKSAFPEFATLASHLNEYIPQHVINLLKERLRKKNIPIYNAKVGVLGIAFKRNSDDERNSPAVKICQLLEIEGATVVKHDPHIKTTESLANAVKDADAIVLATNHPEFEGILDTIHNLRHSSAGCVIFDCWGMLEKATAQRLGFDYIKFGSGKR
ncbi:MAG: nucleotide sugar dehydrogenase [Dehalococcoidia bacterium]|nr:nucleotide sugar dehydrogenase [Dehalococcoidia bacterium]MDD5493728.1 nucleotide sugar dehydrogenase [Dehalococcoidia bacterium]